MGFNGEKAYWFKKDFINAFNQMEKMLLNPTIQEQTKELIEENKFLKAKLQNLKIKKEINTIEKIRASTQIAQIFETSKSIKEIKEALNSIFNLDSVDFIDEYEIYKFPRDNHTSIILTPKQLKELGFILTKKKMKTSEVICSFFSTHRIRSVCTNKTKKAIKIKLSF
jgi:regulator of replication initiation timing